MPLADAVAELVHDGDTVALEGFTHLIPFAAGHEIIRQGRRDLTLVRMTPDIVYDQLIGTGCARKLDLLVGRQPRRGLAAPLPRRDRERLARARSRSRSTATPAWRTATRPAPPGCRSRCCAATSAPTSPKHTDTIQPITCPFTGEMLAAVPAIDPDVTVIHAQRADRARQRADVGHRRRPEGGGARRAPRRSSRSRRSSTSSTPVPGAVVLPSWVVTAVREVPGGAHPSYAQGYSDRDNAFYRAWDAISRDRERFAAVAANGDVARE